MIIGKPPKPNRAMRRWTTRMTRRAGKRTAAAEIALSQRLEFESFEPRILLSAALLPVHGSLEVPGQTNQYTFSLASTTQIYFDSQSSTSNLIDWSLQGPTGTVVTDQSFASSGANQATGHATLSLVPGSYTLTVAAQGTTTGNYAFQLLDIANATPITVGQQVTDQLDPANTANLYQFQGTTGENVFFDSHTLNAQSTTWQVIGPDGTAVFGPSTFGQSSGPDTLTETGTYTLLVEGNVNQTGVADYNFTVIPVTTTQTPLTLGQVVSGNLATPGSTHDYNFTLTQPTKVLFDSLTDSSALQWSLTGSQGTLVSQRAFDTSDGSGISGDDGILLAPGSYTIAINAAGDATGPVRVPVAERRRRHPDRAEHAGKRYIGDAGFSAQGLYVPTGAPLTNAPAAGALALGDADVNGAVAPTALLRPATLTVEAWVLLNYAATGQNVIFQQGAAGAGYALQVGADGHLQFVVDGTVVEAPGVLTPGTWTQVAGTYDGATMRLYVNGVDVADQALSGPITYDTNGATIGASDSNGDNGWQGELNEIRVWNVVQSASAIAANMSLALSPQAGLVADWHLDQASGLTLADSSGNGLNGTLGPIPGTATQLLTFDLTAGQTYSLNVLGSSGDITERFYNPAGYMVFTQPIGNRAEITAEVTGTYTLALEGGIGNVAPATYSVEMVPTGTAVTPTNPAPVAIALGQDVSGQIAAGGETVLHAYARQRREPGAEQLHHRPHRATGADRRQRHHRRSINLAQAEGYGSGSPVFSAAGGRLHAGGLVTIRDRHAVVWVQPVRHVDGAGADLGHDGQRRVAAEPGDRRVHDFRGRRHAVAHSRHARQRR